MPSLTTQTAKINVIISLKDKSYDAIKGAIMVDLLNWCQAHCKMYAYILHDKDVLDNGELKTPHIHLVALLNSNRCRLSTTLNNLSAVICVNEMAITIDRCSDFNGSIQYLIHKNNNDKYQYNVLDITTNMPQGELDVYLNSNSGCVSLESLVSIIKRHRNIVDIIRDVGLNNYRLYRNVIWDIYADIHNNYVN